MLSQILTQTTIIASLQHNSIDVCKKMLLAAYEAGVRMVAYKETASFDIEMFKELKEHAKVYCEDVLLGVGNILHEKNIDAILELEPAFISSPVFNVDFLDKAYYNQVIYIPGVYTPTEAYNAFAAGCNIVTVYPGNTMQAIYVKALQQVVPQAQLIIAEGVAPNKEAIEIYKEAGATGIVLGNDIFADYDVDIVKNRFKNIMY
jgi:2-dehydro-3-deoxyphosphogluconate aldolase / (4S)-4-hydroxy-2-oxoglutarate aldolase